MRFLPNPWLILGLIAALAFAGWQGYRMGVKLTEARIQAATDALQAELNTARDEIAEQASQIIQAQAEKRGLIDALENAARQDPGAANRVPSNVSLQRLRSRWRSDSE